MTTPTREQVVQWAKEIGITIAGSGESITKIIAIARADLEATIAEQGETLRVIRNEYDFKCQQLEEQAKRIEEMAEAIRVLRDALINHQKLTRPIEKSMQALAIQPSPKS